MTKSINSYKDLLVWQRGVEVVELVYAMASELPQYEVYGLASQIRRSAVSIPANIAEGSRRSSRADYRQFLNIAYGSGAELETHLEIVRRVHPKSAGVCDTIAGKLDECMRMLNAMVARFS